MDTILLYAGLFSAAFFAATILPAQSEALLLALTATGNYPVWLLVAVASCGNVLGALVNWWLGRGVEHFKNRKWFPVKESSLVKAQNWYEKYGRWSLLLSWVPFIGDPITVAAGALRERLSVFLLLVGIAKTTRYIALVAIYAQIDMV
jgi:membrane protein YqaA with SNARE-associated domain